ncbi:MAG TPA: site-2 protease family protein, partial [Polyangia bacterium]|nr:site-2 protease family protein [Polyangia bacterium]
MNEPSTTTRRQPRYLLHVGLFLATFLTTTAAGALYVHGQNIRPIADGLPYSVPLLMILVCHEFGHYFTARAHGVDASLPFFIPLPPGLGLGTMGAVIGMRNVTSDRRKLIDIGAAGPLCGLAVAIPVILYGLSLSKVGPAVPHSLQEGNSLLYAVLKFISKGAWLPGNNQDVFMHPTAWAGWAGLLVTMINLLPIGQLDGGHIATAYFGNNYRRFARILHRLLPVGAVAIFAWVYLTVKREAGPRWDWAEGAEIAFGG